MKRIILGLLVVGVLLAQGAGTIVVNTSILATAGTAPTAVVCTVTPITPAAGVVTQGQAVCSVSGVTVFNVTITPPPGNVTGAIFSAAANSNTVAVTLVNTASGLNWSITANGVSKAGSF